MRSNNFFIAKLSDHGVQPISDDVLSDKYLINLKIQDLDLFINNKVIDSDVKMSMLSTYFTPEQIFDIEQNMLEKAKENIDGDNKFKIIALENTKKNLYEYEFIKCI